MSKRRKQFYLIFAAALQFLHFFTNAAGQESQVSIEIPAGSSLARVSGKNSDGMRNLSFLRSIGSFDGLGNRISDVRLRNGNETIPYIAATPGEYVADRPFTEWSYSIAVSPRKEVNAAAHITWIADGRGLLMLGDILPLGTAAAVVRINGSVPQRINDVGNAVFSFGAGFRTVKLSSTFRLEIADGWQFTDGEAAEFAGNVFDHYRGLYGGEPAGETVLRIVKFPIPVSPGQWQAETRGKNITIISSDMPFRTQSLQRLHEQLRHELFHLWIPNGVNLSGDYAWFYEGFALYSSLKLAVTANRIRFDDFLDTLSRARAIDARQTNRMSLIEASAKRWSGAETYLYARGLFTAFLLDIHLLESSSGRRSVDHILRTLYLRYRIPAARLDGTEAAVALLNEHPEIRPLASAYVQGAKTFDDPGMLSVAGLELRGNTLAVTAKPNRRQREMLDRLGYNNWRRSSPRK